MTKTAYMFLLDTLFGVRSEDCILWPYGKDRQGRAMVRHSGKMQIAARLMCVMAHGEPPTPEHEAAHNCGNGHLGCINDLHLRWATHTENQHDRLGHGTDSRGAKHGKSRLTEDDVYAIRAARGVKRQRDTATKFGITAMAVSRIQRKDGLWAWLPDKPS